MIRDDFIKPDGPDPNTWVSIGSPKVSAGGLYLPASGDGVRGKTKFNLDPNARVTVKVYNGSGAIFITPYEFNTRPDGVSPRVPFYRITYVQSGDWFRVSVSDHTRELAFCFTWLKLKVLVKCSGETINFYAVGQTREGTETETLIASTSNMFYNQDVALYLFGGPANVDYVEAGSGRELQATFFFESLMPPLMTVIALVMLVVVLRTLLRSVKRIGVH